MLDNNSPTKKKLIAQFRKRDPTLTDEEISRLLNSTRRFVDLVRKIRSEPQIQIRYKQKALPRINKGKRKKQNLRIIDTHIEDIGKILDKPATPISEAFKKLSRFVDKKQHGK